MGKEIEMKLLTTRAGCHRLFAARTVTKTALPVTEKRLSLKIYIMIPKDGALNRNAWPTACVSPMAALMKRPSKQKVHPQEAFLSAVNIPCP